MKQFAPTLAKPLVVKAAKTPSRGLLERLGLWFGSSTGMGSVAAAVVAAAAAALVISGHEGPNVAGDHTNASASHGDVTPALPPATGGVAVEAGTIDRSVFDRLDRIAPEALTAYRANDFTTVAKALTVRSDRGEAGAEHALGLLYAEGRGVDADRVHAISLLKQAMANGDRRAEHNLAVLQAATARGSFTR